MDYGFTDLRIPEKDGQYEPMYQENEGEEEEEFQSWKNQLCVPSSARIRISNARALS